MQPGEYYIHIKFNNEHVPESPARVIVTPDSADAKKVCIQGLKERGLDVSSVHRDDVLTFTFSLMAHDITQLWRIFCSQLCSIACWCDIIASNGQSVNGASWLYICLVCQFMSVMLVFVLYNRFDW